MFNPYSPTHQTSKLPSPFRQQKAKRQESGLDTMGGTRRSRRRQRQTRGSTESTTPCERDTKSLEKSRPKDIIDGQSSIVEGSDGSEDLKSFKDRQEVQEGDQISRLKNSTEQIKEKGIDEDEDEDENKTSQHGPPAMPPATTSDRRLRRHSEPILEQHNNHRRQFEAGATKAPSSSSSSSWLKLPITRVLDASFLERHSSKVRPLI